MEDGPKLNLIISQSLIGRAPLHLEGTPTRLEFPFFAMAVELPDECMYIFIRDHALGFKVSVTVGFRMGSELWVGLGQLLQFTESLLGAGCGVILIELLGCTAEARLQFEDYLRNGTPSS